MVSALRRIFSSEKRSLIKEEAGVSKNVLSRERVAFFQVFCTVRLSLFCA